MSSAPSIPRLAWITAFVSVAVLGFEISLMRMLLIASWHHFAFLIISVALLGFGASGTVLCLTRQWVRPRADAVFVGLSLLTALSMPVCVAIAQLVPVEARVLPTLMFQQIAWWILFWILLQIPFLLGATVIGLALMLARERLPFVYASNLAGSAAGALIATGAMFIVPASWLPALFGGIALPAALAGPRERWRLRLGLVVVLSAGVAVWLAIDPPRIRMDPTKYGVLVAQFERQGSAHRVGLSRSPRGRVEIYRGSILHEFPFLSMEGMPPPIDAVIIDGHWVGSLLHARTPDEAAVVDLTLMAVPYDLLPPEPRVLLLGEVGGANVWLGARHDASAIDVVQPNRTLVRLLGDRDVGYGAAFLALPQVRLVSADPRHVVEHPPATYDLIQLVALEAMTAGSGGLGGLMEDHLATTEGFEAALSALAPDGLLSTCRGIQSPPRDNLKLFATVVAALRRFGIDRPQDHLVVVRDYLSVVTLVKRSPWSNDDIERVRHVCEERSLTPVWFPGIRDDELNQPDMLDGPTGEAGDWYHHAIRRLCSADAPGFIEAWPFDIRPPTDERPFFLDFCRIRSIGALRATFGDLWLTRADTAYLFVLAAAAFIGLTALVMTLAPLLIVRSVRRAPDKTVTALYFGAIGLGYLLLEMVMLSRLTRLIGDPVHAASITITAFLAFSGLGSLVAQRVTGAGRRAVALTIALLIVVAVIDLLLLVPMSIDLAGGVALVMRSVVGVAVVAPLALLMGFPFPLALTRVDAAASALVPWAWGVNGFASVLAPPLAMVLAMTGGYHMVSIAAIVSYAAAMVLFARLPR
ncbi:MAG: hypothetical protein KAS72_09295 [Phycisphaerales bacterium]|nr:hypothetical protein [Phycisphaerales bacterium]